MPPPISTTFLRRQPPVMKTYTTNRNLSTRADWMTTVGHQLGTFALLWSGLNWVYYNQLLKNKKKNKD